jgi:hypothetical protein
MRRRLLRPLAVLLPPLALLAACAAQPAPKAPGAPQAPKTAATPQVPAPALAHLLCNPAARTVTFDGSGVPEGEQPRAVALTPRYVWVLFHPARLLRVDRAGGASVQMVVGDDGQEWDALNADPLDGSVWLGEVHPFSLHHVSPDLRLSTVRVERAKGDGSFSALLAAPDALYVSPFGAKDQVWRLDRAGHVLSQAFPAPPPAPETADPRHLDRSVFSGLVRDADGRVLFVDGANGKVFAWGGEGWVETARQRSADLAPADRATTVKGVGVGSRGEMWYVEHGLGQPFSWKGRTILLGSHATGVRNGATVLVVPPAAPGGEPRDLLEPCDGAFIFEVKSDATGYVALTERGAIVGDFATAPDLP